MNWYNINKKIISLSLFDGYNENKSIYDSSIYVIKLIKPKRDNQIFY